MRKPREEDDRERTVILDMGGGGDENIDEQLLKTCDYVSASISELDIFSPHTKADDDDGCDA